MPEGHVLHHLTRKHHRWLRGQAVRASSPQGRFEGGAAQLDGQTLLRAEAKGKHAFYHFGSGDVLHVHLGLYGKFREHRPPLPEPRGAVRLRLSGDERGWDLVGPNRCALMGRAAYEAKLASLGEDPLRDDAEPGRVLQAFARSRRAVGAALLDQSVIAGLGNIYRAELLFLAGLSPWKPCREIPPETVAALWANSVTLLRVGARHNQIRILGEAGVIGPAGGDAVDPTRWSRRGRYGERRDRLWVYQRADCKICGGAIASDTLAARTLYFCPTCQAAE